MVLLPCPCSWISASHCACPQLQASPHGADEEAAALRKVGFPGEGSKLPLTRSPAAQRISCYFWGPLRDCRPPTCLTKPQSMALFTERQRQVLIWRTETASMVFSRLPSVSMENVPASDMGVHSQEKRGCLSCLTLACSLNISGQSQVEKQAVAHLPCGNSKETLGLERKRLLEESPCCISSGA